MILRAPRPGEKPARGEPRNTWRVFHTGIGSPWIPMGSCSIGRPNSFDPTGTTAWRETSAWCVHSGWAWSVGWPRWAGCLSPLPRPRTPEAYARTFDAWAEMARPATVTVVESVTPGGPRASGWAWSVRCRDGHFARRCRPDLRPRRPTSV